MSKVLRIYPDKKSESVVSWELESVIYKFNSGFEFSDALVFLDKKRVVVFHFAESHKNRFVGRVFDYQGNLLFDIPFPSLGARSSHIECLYSWSSEIDDGVKIVFGTDSVIHRDFWCDFDLDKQEYVDSNEAR